MKNKYAFFVILSICIASNYGCFQKKNVNQDINKKNSVPSYKNTCVIICFDKSGSTEDYRRRNKILLGFILRELNKQGQYVEIYTLDSTCRCVYPYTTAVKPNLNSSGYFSLPEDVEREINIKPSQDGTLPLEFWKIFQKQFPITSHYPKSAFVKILFLSDGESSEYYQTADIKKMASQVCGKEEVLSIAFYGIDSIQIENVRDNFPYPNKLTLATLGQQNTINQWIKKKN